MAFGKPGRPPEDRLLRQREIFEAVSPLILATGAHRLSMREAAYAACLSIGGLYYYFPTKRELVLHGLDEAARTRLCEENRERIGNLAAWNVEQYVDAYLDFAAQMFDFLYPSVLAALELGHDTFQATLDAGLTHQVADLVEALRILAPELSDSSLEALGRAIRRLTLGTLIDRNAARDELREQLRALIDGYVLTNQPREHALAG